MRTIAMATTQFGRYEPRREIGRVGMATVYRVKEACFGRDVAFKVLR